MGHECEALLRQGYEARDHGDLMAAVDFFTKALAMGTHDVEAAMALAGARLALAQPLAAIAELEPLAERHPLLVPLLAEAFEAAKQPGKAVAWLEKHLATHPSGHLHHHLARLYARQDNPAAAERHFGQALSLIPSDPELLADAARFYHERGQLGPALDLVQRAARCPSPPGDLHALTGKIWEDMAEPEKALRHYELHLAENPEDAENIRARIASLSENGDLSPDFVRGIFDQYADKFDHDLVETLQYRGPAIIAESLAPFLADAAPKSLAILDLGCGTGLSGKPFAHLASRMAGCDLSPKMLEKAAALGIYSGLTTEGFEDALARGTWDLVIAADALVYIGDLTPVFRAVRQSLREDGLFAATFEAGAEKGFVRKPSKRFGHAKDYIRHGAATCGLEVLSLEETSSRLEKRQPVAGFVLVCRKTRR